MRAILRVLRRSSFVGKFQGEVANKVLLERPGSNSLGSSGVRKWIRSSPSHVSSRFCSSDVSGQLVVVASPQSSGVLNEIAQYAANHLDVNPDLMVFGAYWSMIFFIYRMFPKLVLRLQYRSVQYGEYEKCLKTAWANTERHFFYKYPVAALSLFAFSQMSTIIAPSMTVHVPHLWEAASIFQILWAFNVLKENFVVEAKKISNPVDSRLSHFDKACSLGLLSLGFLGIAEVGGMSLQSLITISGFGGVLTAFTARDVLGNILNGFSLQFTQPFKVGEYIKAGSVEGIVVEIGLTCTSLINPECLPISVPNSYFVNQVVVNKSRATILSCVIKIPLKIEDVDKLVALTHEVTLMLKGKPLVIMEKEGPRCYVSRVGKLYGELTVCCETKMKNEGMTDFEQEVILETLKIMRSVGVEVGDPLPSGDLEALLEAAKIIKTREAAYTG